MKRSEAVGIMWGYCLDMVLDKLNASDYEVVDSDCKQLHALLAMCFTSDRRKRIKTGWFNVIASTVDNLHPFNRDDPYPADVTALEKLKAEVDQIRKKLERKTK